MKYEIFITECSDIILYCLALIIAHWSDKVLYFEVFSFFYIFYVKYDGQSQ